MKKTNTKMLSFLIICSMMTLNLNSLFAQEKGTETNGTSSMTEEKKDNAPKTEEPKKKKKKREIGC